MAHKQESRSTGHVERHVKKLLLLLLPVVCLRAVAGDIEHQEIIRNTPCLESYRLWLFGNATGDFKIPDGLTAEQCEAAKPVHARIQSEQAAEADLRYAEAHQAMRKRQAAEEESAARAVSAAKARASKPGARIGMTMKQVINETEWGKPGSINRTTTSNGTTEQWVYGGRNYLYFRNGVLTTIQN